ncbi:LysR family transcriptional regulator [Ferrimonas sediminum]
MRAFVRVVQTGSVSSAAREQSSTQGRIGKTVSALEAKLRASG